MLTRGACASWRIARVVSGRLKAHPYLRYQKDTSLGVIVLNGVLARWLALKSRNRLQALCEYETNLHRLARQLEDARALTWSSDLSDTFGRSQTEIRSLLAAVAGETTASGSKRLPQHELSLADRRGGSLGTRDRGGLAVPGILIRPAHLKSRARHDAALRLVGIPGPSTSVDCGQLLRLRCSSSSAEVRIDHVLGISRSAKLLV